MKIKIKRHHERCGAKTRDGDPCKNWAMPNGRCRMHGGKSTGPRPENRGKSGLKHGATIRRILNDKELAHFKSIRRQLRKDYPNLPPAGEKTMNDLCLCIVRINRLLSHDGEVNASTFSSLESKIRKHLRSLETGDYAVGMPVAKRSHSDDPSKFAARFVGGCEK